MPMTAPVRVAIRCPHRCRAIILLVMMSGDVCLDLYRTFFNSQRGNSGRFFFIKFTTVKFVFFKCITIDLNHYISFFRRLSCAGPFLKTSQRNEKKTILDGALRCVLLFCRGHRRGKKQFSFQ